MCEDICSTLRIDGCTTFKSSVDRPNLFYEVCQGVMQHPWMLPCDISAPLHSLVAVQAHAFNLHSGAAEASCSG